MDVKKKNVIAAALTFALSGLGATAGAQTPGQVQEPPPGQVQQPPQQPPPGQVQEPPPGQVQQPPQQPPPGQVQRGDSPQTAPEKRLEKRVKMCPTDQAQVQRRSDRLRQVQGRIVALKPVEIRGARAQGRNKVYNLVARIENPKGERIVVDLGPRDQLPRKLLRMGARIRVEGRVESIRGTQFVVANRLRVNERVIHVERAAQAALLRSHMGSAAEPGPLTPGEPSMSPQRQPDEPGRIPSDQGTPGGGQRDEHEPSGVVDPYEPR